jgi:hypothetical protein
MNSQDLQQIDKLLSKRLDEKLKNFVTKADFRNLPTKSDLKNELKNLEENLESYILDVFTAADKNKAEKEDVEVLKGKVHKLEEKVFPN